jgi:hypothetical protein
VTQRVGISMSACPHPPHFSSPCPPSGFPQGGSKCPHRGFGGRLRCGEAAPTESSLLLCPGHFRGRSPQSHRAIAFLRGAVADGVANSAIIERVSPHSALTPRPRRDRPTPPWDVNGGAGGGGGGGWTPDILRQEAAPSMGDMELASLVGVSGEQRRRRESPSTSAGAAVNRMAPCMGRHASRPENGSRRSG